MWVKMLVGRDVGCGCGKKPSEAGLCHTPAGGLSLRIVIALCDPCLFRTQRAGAGSLGYHFSGVFRQLFGLGK